MVATSTPELLRIRSESAEKAAKRKNGNKQPEPIKRCNRALFAKNMETSKSNEKTAQDKKRVKRVPSGHSKRTNSNKDTPKVTRSRKKQYDTTRIPRQIAQMSIRKPSWMSQQEQQVAINDSTPPEKAVVLSDGHDVELAMETTAQVTINPSESPQQEQQTAIRESIPPKPTVGLSNGSGMDLAPETTAEVTINSSGSSQQEQQIAVIESISPELRVPDGSVVGLTIATGCAAYNHVNVVSEVGQQDKQDVVHGVTMFYGSTNRKPRPKRRPTCMASSFSEE